MTTPNAIVPFEEFVKTPQVMSKFIGLFRNDQEARRYIESVMILVASSDPNSQYSLQKCTNESILSSALRAVSLRVSVDPAVRQAWLVPRKNKKTNTIEASLQLHYNELRNRALRTGRYQCINVSPVYEGETVMQDIYSGNHLVMLKSGLMTSPEETNRFVPVNERRGKHIGWLGYSKKIRGQVVQTVYMSIGDIEKHVATYNPYWADSKAWKGDSRITMEQKTVLLALLRKEDLGDPQLSEIKEFVSEEDYGNQGEDVVDGTMTDVTDAVDADFPKKVEEGQQEAPQGEKTAQVLSEAEKVTETAQKPSHGRPYDPETFRKRFIEKCGEVVDLYAKEGRNGEVTERQRDVLSSALQKYCLNGDQLAKHETVRWLTSGAAESTKDLTWAQVRTLIGILGIHGDDFTQKPNPVTVTEIKACHQYILASMNAESGLDQVTE